MKNACTYFRYSAACFEKLRDQYTPYSLDFSSDLLTCQVDILLVMFVFLFLHLFEMKL
jgi:hypothetical protein